MPSRSKSCGYKHRHASFEKAKGHISALKLSGKFDGGRLRIYLCRYCHFWHVGHESKGKGRKHGGTKGGGRKARGREEAGGEST